MSKFELTCIICPKGCKLTVTKLNKEISVIGNGCQRGIKYAVDEVTNPKRMITTTIKINNSIYSRLPVISDKEVLKDMIFQIMNEINKKEVYAPVNIGDILISNVLNTGVNIIASRSMEKNYSKTCGYNK